jgi:hypothetical protein
VSIRQEPSAFVKVNVSHIQPKEGGEHNAHFLQEGIDVSSCYNKVRLLDSSGNSLSNSCQYPPGAKTLASKIYDTMALKHFDTLVIGLKAASVYDELNRLSFSVNTRAKRYLLRTMYLYYFIKILLRVQQKLLV